MQITGYLGIILILVVLVGIFRFMFGKKSASPDGVKTPWIRRFFSSSFFNGLLSSVAIGALVHDSSQSPANQWLIGITCGVVVAFLFGILELSGGGKELAFAGLPLIFGVIGLIVTVTSYFTPSGICTPADIGQRTLGFILVALALALGAALAWTRELFTLRKLGPTLLAAFGALQVVEFLSSPLGVALVDLGISGWIVALVAAFALGFAASIWPEFVMVVASIAIAAGSIVGAMSGSQNSLCMPGVTDISALAPFFGYVVAYVSIRKIGSAVLKSKTKSQ